ncbi:MAG: cytochrome c oxidase accessory protein CcoG [bacterium]|nr:cytochrome c oxidase accessory protein CcoG [bacterium]
MAVDTQQLDEIYKESEVNESFRDHLATVDEKGKRIWLFPKKPSGKFFRWRSLVSIVLLTFLFGAPFIKIGEQPLLLFNILERKFVIFGIVFWPQDFFLFAIAFITLVVSVILFTVVYGRIFCGWICPQTIFMEFVFRRIEYLIEGDYMAQRKLKKAPWNTEKIIKRVSKHSIFLIISFLIMHTFMAYIISVERTFEIVTSPPTENLGGFFAMVILTGLFYGVFAWFRDQVCTQVCPYGRLQGVLLDRNSLVVGYDYKRGETRAKFRKKEDRAAEGKGDCIDCKQCVLVCPTGIDIRNGTQLECINCTACIDACDSIMDKIDKPRGLIRYASEENIDKGTPFKFTTRVVAYSSVLVILMTVLTGMLVTRSDIETTILRTPGVMYQKRDDGTISNLYNIKIINKTDDEISIELKPKTEGATIELVGEALKLNKQGTASGALFVVLPREKITSMSSEVEIEVYGNGELLETVDTKFLGPNL